MKIKNINEDKINNQTSLFSDNTANNQNFDYVKSLFEKADNILQKPLSKIILDGPKELIDQTENTQPAIFLISYSICEVIKKETSFNLNEAKFFAGHSLGEYSALACSGALSFEKTIKNVSKADKGFIYTKKRSVWFELFY